MKFIVIFICGKEVICNKIVLEEWEDLKFFFYVSIFFIVL